MKASIPDADPRTAAELIVEQAKVTRAQQYLFALQAYPWLSVTLLLTGILLTGYGLIAWRVRQKKQDEDEDEAFRQRRELGRTTKASAAERDEKLESEAKNSEPSLDDPLAGDAASPGSEREVAQSRSGGRSKPANGGTGGSSQDHRVRQAEERTRIRQKIESIEAQVGTLLEEGFFDTHGIERGVKVVASEGQGAPVLDFVARARDAKRWTSFAVEVHLSALRPGAALTDMAMRYTVGLAVAARGIPQGQVQRGSRGRPIIARSVSISVVVVRDENVDQAAEKEPFSYRRDALLRYFADRCASINSVLARKVGIIVLSESAVDRMRPHEFREIVVGLMEDPSAAFIAEPLR